MARAGRSISSTGVVATRFLLAVLLLAATMAVVPMGLLPNAPADATFAEAGTPVTYKEYWVPHTQFQGGCSTTPVATGYWYLEPGPCSRTVNLNIPDDIRQAAKVEVYLDLWRNRDVPRVQFSFNGGRRHTPEVGSDWSRTPWVGEIAKSEIVQGANQIVFSSLFQVHVHDIAVRVYYDATHPILPGPGSDVTPPTGALTQVVASNGTFAASAGGALRVDNDTLTFRATASDNTGVKEVAFIGRYEGYDLDADGDSNEWNVIGRNNYFPGGRNASIATLGGLIDHIGTDVTSPYEVTWNLRHVVNQSNVQFKVRVVDTAGNVVEAPGGPSGNFALQRAVDTEAYTIADFEDAPLHHDGEFPDKFSRTITLPDLKNVQSAIILGNYWEVPRISLNGYASFRSHEVDEDPWALSIRNVDLAQLGPGPNDVIYEYRGTGFGHFVEKPGPMIILRRAPVAPTITSQPSSLTLAANMAPTFSVTAAGSPPTYQWQRQAPGGAGGFVSIPGATAATYTAPLMTPAESGAQFRVVVTNTRGSVTSNPATLTLAGAAPWWNTQWPYRVEVQVGAAGYARTDQVVEAGINFTTLLAGLGVTGAFAPDSVRVVEANGAGAVTDDHIRYQFDGVSSYEPTTNADGQVVFEMEGATSANQTRRYFVYFGLTTNGIPPFEQDWRIDTINNIIDEGQSSYKVESPGGTWFLQKAAGGFSSLLDANGNDWLSYNSAAGAAGRFRGIPNMVYPEGDLHPGTNLSSTTLRGNGPLRATLQTNTLDDRFGVRWDIYPTHATATITKALSPYWFLYEGTPGGSLQGGGNDYIYRSDGAVNNTGVAWNPQKDIPGEEWLYFADTALNRALYMVHHEDDNAFEYYSPQGTAPDQMTVFGFGRTTEGPLLTRGNQHFTVGLIDSLNPGTVEAQIDRATKPLNLYIAYAQNQTPPTVPAAPVVTGVERGDKSVTLTWEPLLQHGGAAVTSYEISRTPAGPTTVVPGTATSAVVTGLTNGTSYTFTIRARNSVGLGPASTPTDPVTPGTAPSFASDVFNRDTLDAKWRVDDPNALDPLSPDYPIERFPATFVPDPTQAATVVATGQELVIKVPAGASHDLFDSNLMAPRVLQSVANEDLSLTAKYESVPTTLYQFEGIVAQNDYDSFLRFDLVWVPDFFHPTGALQAQASLVENKLGQKLGGVYVDPATRYLRVGRDGNLWTLESSVDGAAWTAITQFPYTMQITEVGLHAGNHYSTVPSATPEFISRVDFVVNDDAPLPDDPIPDTTAAAGQRRRRPRQQRPRPRALAHQRAVNGHRQARPDAGARAGRGREHRARLRPRGAHHRAVEHHQLPGPDQRHRRPGPDRHPPERHVHHARRRRHRHRDRRLVRTEPGLRLPGPASAVDQHPRQHRRRRRHRQRRVHGERRRGADAHHRRRRPPPRPTTATSTSRSATARSSAA